MSKEKIAEYDIAANPKAPRGKFVCPYCGEVVITWISGDDTEFFCVRQDGFFFKGICRHQDDYSFITEYPTWQEAVNSKEFNNGECL